MEKRLERYADEAQIGGVAAGLAHYFNLDRKLVRVLFVAGLFIPHFPAIIPYVILWMVLPERRTGFTSNSQTTIFSNPAFAMTAPDKHRNNLIFGAILIVLGVIALLERYTAISFRDIWPLLLIGFGAWLILRDRRPGGGNPFDQDNRPVPPASSDPYDPNRPINKL